VEYAQDAKDLAGIEKQMNKIKALSNYFILTIVRTKFHSNMPKFHFENLIRRRYSCALRLKIAVNVSDKHK